MKRISIIIPMYNEQGRIADTLDKIKYYMEGKYDYDIIVIDDCSTDYSYHDVFSYVTNEPFHNVKLYHNEKNMGKGFSVKKGLSISEADYFLITDSDLSTPISEIKKLLKHTKKYDLVIGSRKIKSSKVTVKQSLLRRFYSKAFNIIINTLFDLGVVDSQCGFKVYTRKARNLITSKSIICGFTFDIEHLLICKENGIMYKECGVVWDDNKKQSFKIKSIIKMLDELAVISKFRKKGYYGNAKI